MPDSDSDSSTDFFISKRKPNLKASNSDEDPESSGRKKKKRLNSRKHQSKLPEWARQTSEQRKERKRSSVARASTETRDREGSNSSFTPAAVEVGAGKKKERRRVELTPPPVISEKKNQELRELVQRMYGGGSALDLLDDDDIELQGISPMVSPQKEEVVDIVVKMELDPVKKANAPAVAIRMYERPTTLKLRREETMFRALEVMGDKLQRAPEDIVLIYEGKRVYSRDTARQLGILGGSSVEMKGYEKSYWDRLEAERLRRIENFDLDYSNRSPSPQLILQAQAHAQVSTAFKSKAQSQSQSHGASQLYAGLAPVVVEPPNPSHVNNSPPAVADDSIKLVVRGADGKEARMKVAKTVTAHTVLRFYCKKTDRPKDDANKMELVFDGETMGKDATVGDIDCEDGDMLEVRIH
uniref:Ubiquitin-like domain-containing protein n=1 Tax=Cryptococcus bacillisporus CA1280 TaxID=1296109 RepID=A0A0D0VUR1_CRYGA|nr:hypothetical protein I312_00145 [Cryptococcus bacillisporus CA1280]